MEGNLVVTVVSIVGAFLLGGFWWWMVIHAQIRAREMLHAERQAAIAKGLPPPEEPAEQGGAFSPSTPPKSKDHDLWLGLFWTFLGLGFIVALRIVNPLGTSWGWGVIAVALGLSILVYWFIAGRRGGDGPRQDAEAR